MSALEVSPARQKRYLPIHSSLFAGLHFPDADLPEDAWRFGLVAVADRGFLVFRERGRALSHAVQYWYSPHILV